MEKEDKGVVPVKMLLKFLKMAMKAIPGISKQGEKGLLKMMRGAIMLADDLSEEVDAVVDIDGK